MHSCIDQFKLLNEYQSKLNLAIVDTNGNAPCKPITITVQVNSTSETMHFGFQEEPILKPRVGTFVDETFSNTSLVIVNVKN